MGILLITDLENPQKILKYSEDSSEILEILQKINLIQFNQINELTPFQLNELPT